MKKNSFVIGLSLIVLAFNVSCSGGGGISTVFTKPTPTPSIATPTPQTSAQLTNNPAPTTKFTEPLTQEFRPDPQQQFNSYIKIMKALDLYDYDYAYKEYEAGGLKLAAIRAENEFHDSSINYEIVSLIQGIGQIGLNNRNMNNIDPSERRTALNNLLKQVFAYSVRSTMNRLVENNQQGLAQRDDEHSIDVANDASTYFYGSENSTVTDGSIAKMSQSVDTNNALKVKTFDTIAAALNQIKANAKNSSSKDLINYKNQAEKGILKVMYMSALNKLAKVVADKKAYNDFVDAEFYYTAIKTPAESSDSIVTTRIEKILGDKRADILNYSEIEKNINLGFREKALDEMNNAIKNISADNSSAQNSAYNAQLLVDVSNSAYENTKFIKSPDSTLTNNMQNFVNAVQIKNTTIANDMLNKMKTYIYTTGK